MPYIVLHLQFLPAEHVLPIMSFQCFRPRVAESFTVRHTTSLMRGAVDLFSWVKGRS
jgi:hypothetical protein